MTFKIRTWHMRRRGLRCGPTRFVIYVPRNTGGWTLGYRRGVRFRTRDEARTAAHELLRDH